MGSGLIPSGASVYGDSSLFIYAIERHLEFGEECIELLARAEEGDISVVASELVIPECLVFPLRSNDATAVARFEALFRQPWLALEPLDRSVLVAAARIRAGATLLKLPDALHLATMQAAGCSIFVTNDQSLAKSVGASAR